MFYVVLIYFLFSYLISASSYLCDYVIKRMGLVSGIKGPLSQGVKILYHDVSPRQMMCIRLDVRCVQSDARSLISLFYLLFMHYVDCAWANYGGLKVLYSRENALRLPLPRFLPRRLLCHLFLFAHHHFIHVSITS